MSENYENNLNLYDQKKLIYHDKLLGSWMTYRLEQDKTFLIFSAGAISLFITLLTTVKFPSIWSLVFIYLAIIAFLTTGLVIVYLTFDKNSDYVKSILNEIEHDMNTVDKHLNVLDKITRIGFLLGIIFALISGTISATYNFELRKNPMSDNKKFESHALDSIRGLHTLKPALATNPSKEKGLHDLKDLKPKAPEQPVNTNSKVPGKKIS